LPATRGGRNAQIIGNCIGTAMEEFGKRTELAGEGRKVCCGFWFLFGCGVWFMGGGGGFFLLCNTRAIKCRAVDPSNGRNVHR